MSDGEPLTLGCLARALAGALAGAALGMAFLAVGLLRFCAARGGSAAPAGPTPDDAGLLGLYVGGFAAAGALAGATQRLLPGRAGTYVRFALGGVVVTFAITVAERGSPGAFRAADWVLVLALGILFGAAFARGVLRAPGPPG